MYKAIKNFDVQGQSFQIGNDFPVELFEERLIRSKKIELVSNVSEVEIKVQENIETLNEVVTSEKSESKPKKSKKEKVEEILTDSSSDVVIETIEE